MIKRTLCFSNPAILSLKLGQIEIRLPEVEKSNMTEKMKIDNIRTVPIEDIGVIVLDNKQVSVTQALLSALADNNCAVITCNDKHMPNGLMLSLDGNTTQSERYKEQIYASLPLKKQLWQQTVQHKIRNQASVLKRKNNVEIGNMLAWANSVKSGDSENLEGRAAAYYWKNMFMQDVAFVRDRELYGPNAILNYGYAILRAIVARAIVSSGMICTLGIHHRNRYNAYCLADDIMEPYRPYVDELVLDIVSQYGIYCEVDSQIKRELLGIPVLETTIDGERRPLMVAVSETTASLYKCFSGEIRKLKYPTMPI